MRYKEQRNGRLIGAKRGECDSNITKPEKAVAIPGEYEILIAYCPFFHKLFIGNCPFFHKLFIINCPFIQ